MTTFATGQLYHISEYFDKLVIDITVKSSTGIGGLFAPTWSMVMGSKRGEITWDEYTSQYYSLIRDRYRENKKAYHSYFEEDRLVILACYCKDTHKTTKHCHRYLAIDILEKIAEKNGFEFIYKGEV